MAIADHHRRRYRHQAHHHATQRLSQAFAHLNPHTHRRSAALVTAQLATLNTETGDVDQGRIWATRAEQLATQLRSARLASHLTTMRKALADAGQPTTDPQPAHAQGEN